MQLARLRVLAADLHDLAGELGDPERVGVDLGGDADEEVELHPLPALRVGTFDRGVEVFVGDQLVDHLADTPGAALGGEGEPGAADLLDLAGQADGERVDPQRRERQAHVAAAVLLVDQVGDQAVDAGEVGGGQRGERDFVVAGAAQAVAHHGADLLLRAFAHRPGDHPRLAEPAAPGAAPEHLDVEPVVHHFDERHELVLGVRPVAEIGDRALVDPFGDVGEAGADLGDEGAVVLDRVHGGHVDAGDRGQLPQHPLAGGTAGPLPGRDHLGDLADGLFAVADHEGVDEVGHGLGVERAVPADDDERVLGPAILRPHRDAGEVETLEHVGVDELGGQAEGDDVEGAGVVVGVDREQRHGVGPHLRVHVDPGRVGALRQRVVALVQDLVEDLEPLVG